MKTTAEETSYRQLHRPANDTDDSAIGCRQGAPSGLRHNGAPFEFSKKRVYQILFLFIGGASKAAYS